jgi:hypothetical protein
MDAVATAAAVVIDQDEAAYAVNGPVVVRR